MKCIFTPRASEFKVIHKKKSSGEKFKIYPFTWTWKPSLQDDFLTFSWPWLDLLKHTNILSLSIPFLSPFSVPLTYLVCLSDVLSPAFLPSIRPSWSFLFPVLLSFLSAGHSFAWTGKENTIVSFLWLALLRIQYCKERKKKKKIT